MIDRHGDDRLSTRAIRLGISPIQWYNMLSFHPIISMQMRKATSYQRRSGRLSNNQKAQLEQSPFLLRNQDMLAQLLSTHAHQSLCLEIGFGMGEHLLGNAQKNPQKIFIGIDIYRPGIASLLQQIDDHGLKNCYLLEGDAVDYLPQLPEAQFQRIDIHHPDPWPKKRHKKRQLLHADFILQICQKMSEQGVLQIITDDFAYFEHILEQVQLPAITAFTELQVQRDRQPNSKYGRKAVAEGREINAIELHRTAMATV